MSVGKGFIAARTTIGSPFETPASIPPARFVRRARPGSISSWASVPRRRASAKPSPTSTPFTAWIPISANASRASSRSPFSAYEPSPGGTPVATHLDDPAERVPVLSRGVGRLAHPLVARLAADLDRSPGDLDPELAQQRLRDGTRRDVHRGVARARHARGRCARRRGRT